MSGDEDDDGPQARATIRGFHKPDVGDDEPAVEPAVETTGPISPEAIDAAEAHAAIAAEAAADPAPEPAAPGAPATGRDTAPNAPDAAPPRHVQRAAIPLAADFDASKSYSRTPMVEIEVVHQHGPAPRSERPWRTLEVWTRNRVYTMDPSMTCIEVSDRISNKVSADHAFLGSRLVGGQHREGQRIELSCPFPRPGTEAVFEHPEGQRGGFSRTSTVTRVVLRLHVVTVAPSYVVPTWETITGSMAAVQIPGRDDE